NATSGLGVDKLEGASAYRVLLGEVSLYEKIQRTAYDRLDIIPSEIDMCGAEIEVSRLENHLLRLRQAVEPLRRGNQHELILVDCLPSLGILTVYALATADYPIVPLPCVEYSLE